ncbi:PPOX class F420-dependent oxidoreductase [Pseudonocardiaceae bacterium YIM PH 21723]|nr:PPOX class F420-dependent oxidoreductase [Pseudonocardiaceae bacterium YIM PH 21723]
MRNTLSAGARALIDAKNFASLATLNADGSPQNSVIWIARDGDDLLFGTAEGAQKAKNLRRDPRVSISVFDLANPYHYIEVRGTVTLTPDPAGTLTNSLAVKYWGKPWDELPAPDPVIVRVTPTRVYERND